MVIDADTVVGGVQTKPSKLWLTTDKAEVNGLVVLTVT